MSSFFNLNVSIFIVYYKILEVHNDFLIITRVYKPNVVYDSI